MKPLDAEIPLPVPVSLSAGAIAPSPADPHTCVSSASAIDGLLNPFAHFGVELGLSRIRRLLAALGDPHLAVPVIHVAGSNGKGSVCAYLSTVLTAAGYRVGLYTSPHLIDWTDRICVNGQAIAPDHLHRTLQQVIAAIEPTQVSPTQFEVITAAAWLHFAQLGVDLAVIEVGLGGRLDATNVCDRPLVSVITSLSREHWQRLGPTLADITYEKAGILKPHCPAVIAPQPGEALPVLQQRLAADACPVVWVTPARDLGNSTAQVDGEPPLTYTLPLGGAHQLTNSAVAIATLRGLQQQGWRITDEQIGAGIAKTQWPGRMQWVLWQGRSILIDGAHNAAGAVMLRRYVEAGDRPTAPMTWVLGMLSNKDHADVLRALLREGDRLYPVPVPDHLTAAPQDLATLGQALCPGLADCIPHPDLFSALQTAYQATGSSKPQGTVILCGSLYLIGQFFRQTQALSPLGLTKP